MHSVQRSPEPGFFAELRASYNEWDNLQASDRVRIRRALEQDFGQICAYCEQLCKPPRWSGRSPNDATIDHFRPRHLFPANWLDWLNLAYSCRRCNENKGGSWPGYDDTLINFLLIAEDSRYTPVSEYVNPSFDAERRPAHEFFGFNTVTGEIAPAEDLTGLEWSMARRTIRDIDLNDSELGLNDPYHLWYQRLQQLDFVLQALDAVQDFDTKSQIMFEFMLPDKPFSGFISAYFMNRFPSLARLLRQP